MKTKTPYTTTQNESRGSSAPRLTEEQVLQYFNDAEGKALRNVTIQS